MNFEDLTRNERELIIKALEDKGAKLLKDIEFWKELEWKILGENMQKMYANEQAFEIHKKGQIEDKQEDIKIIGNLLKRMYEM